MPSATGSAWRCAATATSASATTNASGARSGLGGLRSLWVGVPIVVIGYLLVIFEDRLVGHSRQYRARHHGVGAGVGGNLVPARHNLLQPSWVRAGEPRPQAPARRRDLGDKLATHLDLTPGQGSCERSPGREPGRKEAPMAAVLSFGAAAEAVRRAGRASRGAGGRAGAGWRNLRAGRH